MGKKSGASWFTIVKRAFRSPSKETEKKGSRRRDEHYEPEEDEKKREKRRWPFRKHTNNITQVQQQQQCHEEKVTGISTCATIVTPLSPMLGADQRHAMAVAAATAAAAEAAAMTAKAAAEIVRLTRPSSFVREQRAAVVIQTSFRGYLFYFEPNQFLSLTDTPKILENILYMDERIKKARRALRALRGLVKLQAVVRGQNVRKQAKLTLKCMQALVRVQDRIRDQQRARLSHEGSRKSIFSTDINFELWESNKYLRDVHERKSMSRDVSSTLDDWDDRARAIEEDEDTVQCRKKAALKKEKALAYAFSNQIWRYEDMERWMATKQWDNSKNISRASTSETKRDIHIKTVEVDTSTPPTSSRLHNNASDQYSSSTTTPRRSTHNCHLNNQHMRPQPNSPITPSSACKPKPIQVRSASPRCLCYSVAQTPSFGSRNNNVARVGRNGMVGAIPNYMAATESAKAKARSHSAPRQRPSTPERDRGNGAGGGLSSSSSSLSSARKRLSYPVPQEEVHHGIYGNIGRKSFSQSLRSPSFKSISNVYMGMEQCSNYSSCYTESVTGGEISPCSTTDHRWLK